MQCQDPRCTNQNYWPALSFTTIIRQIMRVEIYVWRNPSNLTKTPLIHLILISHAFRSTIFQSDMLFVAVPVGSGTSTLFIHFQVCCRAPLGWLWQGPPNVRRWPMLRSQAARPECVWPGWKVPFRPSAASLPLLPSTTESHSERREEVEDEETEEEEGRCGTKVWTALYKSSAWMYTCVTHIIRNVCKCFRVPQCFIVSSLKSNQS